MPRVDETRRVVLMIADISGYTRFMTSNSESLAHAQAIITDLIETIVEEVEIPLRVSKLEGDAVFLWAERTPEACAMISAKLLQFLEAFAKRVDYLVGTHACECGGCANVDKLELKLIVHAGEALFHRVAGFEELAGVDVILIHRLLKNSVPAHEYILLTDPAWDAILPPFEAEEQTERYDDIGDVGTRVYVPANRKARVTRARAAIDELPAARRIAARVPANVGMFFWLTPPARGRKTGFTHEEVAAPVPAQRRVLGVVGRIFSPILLFMMSVVIVYRELRRRKTT